MPEELHALDDPMIEWRPELPVAPIVIQLLAAAGQAWSPAQTSTKRLIDRTLSLLERDSTKDVPRDTGGRFTGGPAPWQVMRVSQFIDGNLAAPLPTWRRQYRTGQCEKAPGPRGHVANYCPRANRFVSEPASL